MESWNEHSGRNGRLSPGLASVVLELVSYVHENQIKYSEINQQVSSSFSQTGSHLRDALQGKIVGSGHGSLGLCGPCVLSEGTWEDPEQSHPPRHIGLPSWMNLPVELKQDPGSQAGLV